MHELRKQVANKRPILEDYLAIARAQAAMEETSRQVMDPGVLLNVNDKTDGSSDSSVSDNDSSQSDDAKRSEFSYFEEVRAFLVNSSPFKISETTSAILCIQIFPKILLQYNLSSIKRYGFISSDCRKTVMQHLNHHSRPFVGCCII